MEKEIINDYLNENFIKTLISIDKKSSDRDNTILNTLSYENFEEYFEDRKVLFVVTFSTEDKMFSAIIRTFIMAQLHCITKDWNDNEAYFKLEDNMRDIVNQNIEELKDIILKKYPKIYTEIQKLNNQ